MVSRVAVRQSVVGDLCDRLFEGSASLLLSSLVEQNNISQKELDEIRKVIQKRGARDE